MPFHSGHSMTEYRLDEIPRASSPTSTSKIAVRCRWPASDSDPLRLGDAGPGSWDVGSDAETHSHTLGHATDLRLSSTPYPPIVTAHTVNESLFLAE